MLACIAPTCVLFDAPSTSATAVSEVLFGETVSVLAKAEAGFIEVECSHDAYRGFAHAQYFAETEAVANYRVSVRSTLVFASPNIKTPPVMRLPFGAKVCAEPTDADDDWAQLAGYGWVRQSHLHALRDAPLDHSPLQFAGTHYLGAPYLWGGRSSDGCDCSGLVQVCHAACGLPLPRDSGDQEHALAHSISLAERRSGDLVFWPGHVAILIDPHHVRHATAHSLSVCDEPLDSVVARAGPIRSMKRPHWQDTP